MRVREAALVVVVFAAGALAGCTDAGQRFAAHLARAETSFSGGDYEKARIELKNALQIAPDDVDASFRLGRTLEKLGRWREAGAQYLKVVRLAPGHLDAHLALGRLYIATRAPDKAVEQITAALDLSPFNADALVLRATTRLYRNDLDGAVGDAQGALNRAPERTDIAAFLASVLAQDRRFAEAAAVIDRTLRAHSDAAALWEIKARIAARRGHKAEAAAALEKLLALEPRRRDARSALAGLDDALGRPADARAVLERAVALEPGAIAPKLAVVQRLVRRHGAAAGIAKLRSYLAAEPRSPGLRFALAELAQLTGDGARAEALYREVIGEFAAQPPGLRARLLLARSRARAKDIAGALALAAEVLQENPLDREALLLKGALSLARNDPESAILSLRTVLRDHPDDQAGRALLARAHVLNNEWAQARDVLQRAIEADPGDLDAHFLLVQLIDQGDASLAPLRAKTLRAARALLDTRIDARPDDVASRLARGRVALLERRFEAAREDFGWVVERDERNAEAQRLLARALLLAGDVDGARARFEAAVAADPAKVESRVDHARFLADRGRLDAALAVVRHGLTMAPDAFALLRLEGQLYRDLGQWGRLGETARRLQRRAGERPIGYYLEGIALQATGRLAGSVERFQAALQRSPNAVEPLTALARSYFAQGRPDDALATLDTALGAAPNNLAALNLRGEVLLGLHRLKEAEASFERALAVRPDWALPHRNLGRARLARGDAAGALEAFTRARDAAPGDLLARYPIALAYEQLGKLDLAIAQYEAILTEHPDQQIAANNLAMLLVSDARRTPASLARAAALTAAFEGSARLQLRDTRAWVLLLGGEAARALPVLRRLVAEDPDEAVFRYHLAVAQLKAGDRAAARANLGRALASGAPFEGRERARATLERLRG